MTKEEKEIIEKNIEMLYKRRDMLDIARMKHADSLDKYLLSFATGSLYLSIHFTENLEKTFILKCLLSVGWLILLLSIITVLFSFYFGEKAHERQMEINEDCIDALHDDQLQVDKTNKWNQKVETCKLFSISAFIIGVIALTIFYFINL